MTNKPLILVTGATGAQGGSVVRHLLQQNRFTLRCLTRNAESENAQALRAAGADVVQGDLGDIDSLHHALRGCYGVFGVTNFWEHFEKEFAHGKNLIDAVHAANIKHFVFSTLVSAHQVSGGRFSVPHLDIKAELEAYARSLNLRATYVHVAFYYENFFTFFPPRLSDDGNFHIGFPQGDTKLAAVSVDDVGGVVASIFASPSKFMGEQVGIVGEDLTVSEYMAQLSEATGRKHVYDFIPHPVYAAFNFPGAGELANMFEFNRLYIPERTKDLQQSKALFDGMQSFAGWLSTQPDRLAYARHPSVSKTAL
ncbi:NmrA/HSCARG family protein [Chryseolinea lacunae]|uniref:NmrA/HSCARG family protein n=1 Tax=Chryseolinea lacunae TaxID=2801331 RepID=A0ABS1KXE3_9BACT|nr:NmrA/HSCARG family protein [Chryseolinea lacunae]MBL0744121.1 NmrA/HSCARG family protein [Chryseolinea lacunae]